MSELVSEDAALGTEKEIQGDLASPGALIKQARESAGVHVDVLAAALKITVDKMESLEADSYASFPDMVFARALAASACRILRIDSAPVLSLMPKNQIDPLSRAHSDINAAFRDGAASHGGNYLLAHFKRPLFFLIFALVLGSGVLFFLPKNNGDKAEATSNTVAVLPDAATPSSFPNASPNILKTEVIAVTEEIEKSSLDSSEIASTPAAEGLVVAEKSADVVHVLLEFHARQEAWVQVRDAAQAVVLERTLAKGGVASATGVPPLSVVVGRADATDVLVRGVPFPLAPVAKENVARFKVN